MKKVLSLVLVIAMILSSFSFAFAAKFEDVEGDYEEAIDTLVALGVITGYEDGTFRPNQVVTRAEMAKLIVEILGYGDLVSGAKSNFADTQGHWADPWIAIASGRGLVLGDGDGNFRPNDPVSYDEAITMIIRALGYTDDCNELKGMTWPTNFKVKASELDLLDGLKSLAGGADRGGIAQLLFNALEAILVTVDSDGNVVYVKDANKEDKPLLSRLADKVELKPVKAEYVDPDHKNYKGDVVDLTPYMYQNITVYEKDDVVVYVKSVDSLVLQGTITEFDGDYVNFVVEDADEDEYEFFDVPTGTAVFLNGAEVDLGDFDLEDAVVTVVLEGEDGDKIKDEVEQDVVGIVARLATMTVQALEDFDEDEEEIYAEDENVVLPLDDDEIDYDKVVVKGDAEALEDIKEDDVLTLFYAGGEAADDVKLEIIVSRATVEGKVTKKSGSEYTIGGKAYKLNGDATADFKVGDEGTFFLDYEGKIFAFVEEGEGTPGNYALVLKVTNGYQTTPGGVVLADPKVKVLTAEGEEVTYELDLDLGLVVDESGQTIEVLLEKGDVIEYDLDKDGVIDELTVVEFDSTTPRAIATDVNSFNLASNAVIFNVPDGDVDDAAVIDADELDDDILAFRYRNTDGDIEVLYVLEGGAEVEGIFALFTKDDADGNLAWDEDEEEEVIVYTVYVDGQKVEYLKHEDFDFDGADEIEDDDFYIYELKLSGGKLKDVFYVDNYVEGKADGNRVTKSITDADTEETYFLADDVVVYVLKWDADDAELEFSKVGSKSDIRNKDFVAYDIDDEPDGDYDIVVVYPEEYFAY
jgi:hypothetical protein